VRIVNMWKQKGYITAMTGDGVNDAPAIKSGDIGVGMGITGTDVTKNVADMVLADDNFATIVSAVEEGRRIYDNIRKTLQFLLSTNLAEVIAVFTATMMGFVLFRPIHLLFINLVTDILPAVALGMEHAEPGIMKRPPRKKNESVFSDGLGISIIYQGIAITIITLASYFIVYSWGRGHAVAMTSAFFALSMCEIFQAFALRSLKHSMFRLGTTNKVLWLTLAVSLCLTLSVIYIPPLATMFVLVPLTIPELSLSIGLGMSIIPVVEVGKIVHRAIDRRRSLAK
jgi:Ca2+-transporting ATPase